jgi:hypothetical protein
VYRVPETETPSLLFHKPEPQVPRMRGSDDASKATAGHNAAESGFKREEANSSDDRKLLRTLNVISFHFASGIQMAGHQDARYIPPRRERDRSPRRWRDRFAVWLVLAAVVMVVVALLAFRAMFV